MSQWLQDKQLRLLLIIGFLVRATPMVIWMYWPCLRDECTYLRLANRLADGMGMTSSAGWLWAPGYPFLVSIHKLIIGQGASIKGTQVVLSLLIIVLIYQLGYRMGGQKSARFAAFFYALSPTMIFFSQSLWSECIYGGLLLLALLCFDGCHRHTKAVKWPIFVGLLVGCCVLFRGVATYMLPIFGVALLWQRWRNLQAWKQLGIMLLCAVLSVAPYSIYATKKFGTFVISDRTIGQMMWLGNNDFKPLNFDWGNGQLSFRAFKRHTKIGRRPCPNRPKFTSGEARDRWAMKREDCQTRAGIMWIKDNPYEFVARMPLRVAQLLNPHSFLTRHIRSGRMNGMPQWADEVIVLWNALWSLLIMWGGMAVLMIRTCKPQSVLVFGILLYHVAAISVLAGLTRYRVPLEPLLMLYLAWGMGDWSGLKADWKRASSIRIFSLVFVMAAVILLSLYFLPSGWAGWQHW